MRKMFTLIAVALLTMTATAKDRSEQAMQSIALQTLLGSSAQAPSPTAKKAQMANPLVKCQSLDMVNVYGIKGSGIVFVSKDDSFEPVLGLSDGYFDVDQMPCGMKWWLGAVDQSLKSMKAAGKTYHRSVIAGARATNFIKTSWNQGTPYSNLCPQIDGAAAPTGCIATAMAQIMYYYKYPTQGKGSGTYYVTTYKDASDTKGTTTSYKRNLANTYAWNKMKTSYGLVTSDEDNAVATLMADAGASSNMQYTADASGTSDWYAVRGFVNNFGYDSLAVNRLDRDFYTDQEWMDMIQTEMQAKRPILYCGVDQKDGGHAFVFDGIQEDGKVHVNWGWGGTANGWYAVDVLKPMYNGNSLVSGEGFNTYQSMVLGFKAQETPDADEENTSLWVTDGYSFSVVDNQLHAQLIDVFNYSHRYFQGTVDLVAQDVNDASKLYTDNIYQSEGKNDYIAMTSGFYMDKSHQMVDFNISNDIGTIAPGTYKVFLGSKSTGESNYQCLRGVGGPISYTLTVGQDGTLSLTQDGTTAIASVGAEPATASPYTYIYNMQGQEVYKAKTSDFRLDDVPASGVLLIKQGNQVTKVVK